MFLHFRVLLPLFLLPGIAWAQDAPTPVSGGASEPEQTKDESASPTVTTSAPLPMRAFDSERSENIVDDDQIRERQAQSITDALDEEPGILIQSTNRGAGTLILRGLVGPENLIYFDGVRFNQSTFRTGPNQYLNMIDPWALRRIDVVRGPGSVLYGSGAMGGVLRMIPRELPDETVATSRFGFRSADTSAGASLDAGTGNETFSARAGVTARRHGMLRIGSNGSTNDPFVAAADGTTFLAQPYNEMFWRGGIGAGVGDHSVRVNYFGGSVTDAMRVDRVGDGEVRVYDNQDHLAYVTYEFDGPRGVDELHANVSWHRTSEDVRRYNCETTGVAIPGVDESPSRVADRDGCIDRDEGVLERQRLNRDLVDTLGTSFTGVSRLLDRELQITWGGDAYTDAVQSERSDAKAPDFVFEARDRGNFSDGSTYTTLGLFGTGRYDIWSNEADVFRAQIGARVENFSANAPNVTDQIGDVSYSFTGIVGSAGVTYLRGTDLNLYLHWNQGFRAPNLQESTVLGDSGNFYEVPNPDLGPERSDTFEFGAKVDWSDVIKLRPSLWVSLLSNRITREPTTFEGQAEIDDKTVAQRVNRDSAYFYGADLAARTHAWKGASLFGNVGWTDGAVEANGGDPNFMPGPLHGLLGSAESYENPRRLPPFQYLLGLRYEPDDSWFIEVFMQGAGAQDKLSPGDLDDQRICEAQLGVLYSELGEQCPGSGAWTTFNVRAGYRYEAMTLDFAALNLTDERYRRHGSGVPDGGISLGAQLTLEY